MPQRVLCEDSVGKGSRLATEPRPARTLFAENLEAIPAADEPRIPDWSLCDDPAAVVAVLVIVQLC